MSSHTLIPTPARRLAPAAIALLALLIVAIVPAAALAAPLAPTASGQPASGATAIPPTALLNAALAAGDGIQAAEPAPPASAIQTAQEPTEAEEALAVSLRELAAHDAEIVTSLVYDATQEQAESTRQPYEMSLLDAVEMALRNNFQVQIARYGPQANYEGITQARGAFDPQLTFTAPTFSRQAQAQTRQLAGADVLTSTGLSGTGFQWSENLEWGTNYSLNWSASRNSSNDVFATFNPNISTNLRGSINQPLLNGFGDVNRINLRVSRINYDSSLEAFRGSVQNVVLQTINAYWSLRAAVAALGVAQESLTLAEQQFDRNRIQVEIGTLAPIEMVQAETQREGSRLSLISAQLQLEDAQEQLKQLLNFDTIVDDPQAYGIVPTDEPETTVPPINADEAIQTALANDPSIRQQRFGLQTAQLSLDGARNGLLPNLNLSASFNLQGRAGDRTLRDTLGGAVLEVQQTSFWASQAQIFSGDLNSWQVGASISFPLHNYGAEAAHARASIGERQSVTQLAQAEQNIIYTVRNNVRQVENLVRQVETATLTSQLTRRQLDAEQRKFDVGTSTNFEVLTFQNQLSSRLQSELNTILALQRAIAQLEASKGTLLEAYGVSIEQAGVGGGIRR